MEADWLMVKTIGVTGRRASAKQLYTPKQSLASLSADGSSPVPSSRPVRVTPDIVEYAKRPPQQTSPSVSPHIPVAWMRPLSSRLLHDDYLSRDPSPSKRAAYIRRTMTKAQHWVAR